MKCRQNRRRIVIVSIVVCLTPWVCQAAQAWTQGVQGDDIAVLQLEGDEFSHLTLAPGTRIGARAWIISDPSRQFYTFTEGMVSARLVKRREGKKTKRISVTAEFGMGSSGAPVFDKSGYVVGMLASTQPIQTHSEGQPNYAQMVLKHCGPTESILDLFSDPGTHLDVPHEAVTLDVAEVDQERILRLAREALGTEPIALTDHKAKHSEGGLHDFYSNGDYWWPDPNKADGLPYIRRDGQSNPDNFSAHRLGLRRMRNAVASLAAAYAITGDNDYAAKAVELLTVFFLDDATRMNPSLLYAQAIPGRVSGRGIGIIDTLHLAEIPLAILALDKAPAMTPDIRTGLNQWFAAYADWMTTHAYGQKEMNTKNNHSVAFMLQLASFATLTGDQYTLALCRVRFKEVFLPDQMALDGSFPQELRRTKPYGYAIFQLDNMVSLCQLLSTDTDNLWTFSLPDGRSITKAVAWLHPFLKDKSSWPLPQDVQYWDEWPVRQPTLLFAGLAENNTEYLDLWKHLESDPTNLEVRRNMAVTQPLLWILAAPKLTPDY